MKKLISCTLLALLFCSFWLATAHKAEAVDNLLAYCMQPPTTVHTVTGFMSESFKPTVNRITSGTVTMVKEGGGSAAVTVGISTNKYSAAGGYPTATVTVNSASATIYDFSLTADVDANTTYYLYASSSDGSVGWSAVKDYAACYSNGQGLVSGTNYDDIVSDYNFALYGLNYTPGPIISSLGPSTITQTTATIYWATSNVMSTSRVNYGTTTGYGSTKYSGSLVNSHLVTIDSLSPGTLYHYQVISGDGVNLTTSADNTFTTQAEEVASSPSDPSGGQTTTPTPTPTLAPGTSAGTGAAPSTKTSTAIKPPTGLAATDTNNTVSLSWTASTTADIDGYNIYRSTEEKTGFTNVGKSEKTVLLFNDVTAVAGTKYYYFVRAYKGTSESASSDTVNVVAPAAAVAATTTAPAETVATEPVAETPVVKESFWHKLIHNRIYLGAAILIILGIAAVIIVFRKRIAGFFSRFRKPQQTL